jgi:hypothetical protein
MKPSNADSMSRDIAITRNPEMIGHDQRLIWERQKEHDETRHGIAGNAHVLADGRFLPIFLS